MEVSLNGGDPCSSSIFDGDFLIGKHPAIGVTP